MQGMAPFELDSLVSIKMGRSKKLNPLGRECEKKDFDFFNFFYGNKVLIFFLMTSGFVVSVEYYFG